MKIISILAAVYISLMACTGDCLSCHPKLLPTIHQDTRHKPMLTCIKCHSANPDKMADCGSDCFACHSIKKIEEANVVEHKVIRGCRDCHMKLKKELFSAPPQQSVKQPLKDFLLN
ncbi:hypothetical protein [Sulfurimonas sp. HSL-1716]|uniref:hypothetical protein n=1 Tax=Hydrocurvibacter sulfurireducens TaxID=3131937 RepID=UPI0031F80E90